MRSDFNWITECFDLVQQQMADTCMYYAILNLDTVEVFCMHVSSEVNLNGG